MIRDILIFVICATMMYTVDSVSRVLTGEKLFSFLLTHSLILVHILLTKQNNLEKALLWFFLTITHGIAHICHPPFINGTEVNPNYTPLYDYVIHGFQCLMVWYYHKDLLPFGIFGAIVMIVASAMSHLNKKELESSFWLFASGWGVFGAVYQMMLLNTTRNNLIYKINWIIWSLPYVGYLIPEKIPVWDEFVNHLGLFRLWFGAYYVAQEYFSKSNKFESTENMSTEKNNNKIIFGIVNEENKKPVSFWDLKPKYSE